MSETFHGSCLCGHIRYQLSTPPKAVSHCHCSQCRKGHGAAFATYGSVPRSALSLQGAELLKTFHSSPSVSRQFCGQCGATLFWSDSRGDYPDWIAVALGTLDSDFHCASQKHIYTASRASWYEIDGHWPQEP
ncbi:GFA family protein [Pseudomonas sp. abacavir_1]